jgi:thiamine biosynthesis lipoprotein
MSPALFGVLEAAHEVSAWSDGAFDITVAPLVESWGFGTVKKRAVPAETEVRVHRAAVGWRGLAFSPAARSVVKSSGATQVDLGGIAKGYGVDVAAAALERRGVEHYMIEVGGEVRTRGLNAKGEAWRIGIEEPDAMPQRARHVVPLAGRAMATSGDYRNYFEQGGRRYSHEIDPATGTPVTHAVASVTVVADDCMRADALATALIVLGESGFALAESSGVAAQFIVRRGTELVDHETTAFAALGARRA